MRPVETWGVTTLLECVDRDDCAGLTAELLDQPPAS